MCLAIPGQIESVMDADPLLRAGRVRFGGIVREINLAWVPEASVGDYVLVHVGVAIGRIDEAEARRTLEALESLEEPIAPPLEEFSEPPPGRPPR